MIAKENIVIFCLMLLCPLFNTLQSQIVWSDPVTISSANIDAANPQAVMDALGNATAAWVENSIIKASSLPAGGSWSTPVALSNSLNTASNPLLGIDSSGNVTAIWVENDQMESATLPFGGSWSSSETSPISGSEASSPALSVDDVGNAVAIWVSGGVIETSTRISGTWGSVATLSPASSDFPQVAISANGTVIAAWHSVVSGTDAIMSATQTIGGIWNSAVTINTDDQEEISYHNYPQVAIDSNGNAIIAWFGYNYSAGAFQQVAVLTSSLVFQASVWTFPFRLSRLGNRNPSDLILIAAFDAVGNAITFWTNSYDGECFNMEASMKPSGGIWSASAMPYGTGLYSFAADIDINSQSSVLAIYMTWNGSSLNIQSQECCIAIPKTNAWTIPIEISEGSYNGYPQCAWSLTGDVSNAIAVWINYNGTNTVIQASAGSETAVMPPTNLTVVQNMTDLGVYNDYVNTIAWQASPSSNILQYNIFRNGVFFKSTDPYTLQIDDHNAVQNGSVTYGVAAVDNCYSQSSIATVNYP